VLALVLGVPAVSRMFAFQQPSPALLVGAAAAALLSLLWLEGVKRLQGS
jgi:Ca2+-transporting ATPase